MIQIQHALQGYFSSLPVRVALVALCVFAGCKNSGGVIGTGAGAGTANPGASGNFSQNDMAGDWVGTLTPATPLAEVLPFFLRHDLEGEPFQAMDGRGRRFTEGNTRMDVFIDSRGRFEVELRQVSGLPAWTLLLAGQLNASRTAMDGVYTLTESPAPDTSGTQAMTSYNPPETGTFSAVLSSGPGHFPASLLGGRWEGRARANGSFGKSAAMLLELDEFGSVLRGGIEGRRIFVSGGVNTGIFTYYDDSLGLLGDVKVLSRDGTYMVLPFALVDDTGSILAGPARDTKDSGRLHLQK